MSSDRLPRHIVCTAQSYLVALSVPFPCQVPHSGTGTRPSTPSMWSTWTPSYLSFYTLYVEHMGTLIPVLEAHMCSSKIRQSLAISLPTGSADPLPAAGLSHVCRLAPGYCGRCVHKPGTIACQSHWRTEGGGGLGGLQPPLSSYYIIRKVQHK